MKLSEEKKAPTTKAKNARRRSLVNILFQLPSIQMTSSSSCSSIVPDADSTRITVLEEQEMDKLARSIPLDVLKEIAEYLCASDMLNLSLVSKHVYSLLLPSLYHTVTLSSSSSCINTLPFLLSNPSLSNFIHKIVLRPNYYLSWPREDMWVDERSIAGMVGDIAVGKQGKGGGLLQLDTFDWDGLEMPESSLWTILKKCCPRLTNVFTNIGRIPIDPQSSLFSFTNLTSFSMIVRHGLGGSELFPTPTPLPPRLWDMLLHSCPNLKELALCSFSSSFKTLNFERVVEGRWPALKTLTLGGFGYERDFGVGPRTVLGQNSNVNVQAQGLGHGQGQGQGQTGTINANGNADGSANASSNSNAVVPPPDSPLGRFIDAHTELKYVRFLWNFKRWMSPEEIGMHLSNTVSTVSFSKAKSYPGPTSTDLSYSLPALETFIGIYQQLSPLPSFHPTFTSIRTLDLTCEPIYEQRAPALSSVLKRLVNLNSLDIWVHLHFDESRANRLVRGLGWTRRDRDYTSFYEQVFGSCGKLEELHWMVTTGFGAVPLTQLLSKLHLMPVLKRFSLTKGHRYMGDESMLNTAVRILKYGYQEKKRTINQAPWIGNSPLQTNLVVPITATPSSPSPEPSTIMRPNPGTQSTTPAPHASSRPIPSASDSTPINSTSDSSPSSTTSSFLSFLSDPRRESSQREKKNKRHLALFTYPKLEQINIRWAREKCANHLKQEGTYDVLYGDEDEDSDDLEVRGYEIPRVVALEAAERGIPVVGKPFLRRYNYALNFERRKSRTKGVVGLHQSRSSI